jgi:hypothetical protein
VTTSKLRYLSVLLVILVGLRAGIPQDTSYPAEKDGMLVVLVTWGDISNTPANNVYVEAYGFVQKSSSKKSFILKMSRPGRYEALLPPGVYDVFVSEGTSIPRCRRLLVRPGQGKTWTLKLEIDEVFTQN